MSSCAKMAAHQGPSTVSVPSQTLIKGLAGGYNNG